VALARGKGLVLVLDDLHWADNPSLDVTSLLMEIVTLVPLLLVCIYRPDHEHRVWHLSSAATRKCADRYLELTLGELTESQSRRLIGSLLDIADLAPAFNDLILQKAQGNP